MTAQAVRYFLDADDNGHWYLVPAEMRSMWNDGWEDERDFGERFDPESLDGVERLNHHLTWLEFENPHRASPYE